MHTFKQGGVISGSSVITDACRERCPSPPPCPSEHILRPRQLGHHRHRLSVPPPAREHHRSGARQRRHRKVDAVVAEHVPAGSDPAAGLVVCVRGIRLALFAPLRADGGGGRSAEAAADLAGDGELRLARPDEDLAAAGGLDDLPGPGVDNARLQHRAQDRVQHAAGRAHRGDEAGEARPVGERPGVAPRQQRGGDGGDGGRARGAGEQPRRRDAAVRARRTPAEGGDEPRPAAREDAQLAGKRVRCHGGVVPARARQSSVSPTPTHACKERRRNAHDDPDHQQLPAEAARLPRAPPRAGGGEHAGDGRVRKHLRGAARALAAAGAGRAYGELRLDVALDLRRGRAERVERYQQHEREVVGVRSVDAGRQDRRGDGGRCERATPVRAVDEEG